MAAANQTATCWKCSGSGLLREYASIANGVCFRCAGTGKITYRKGGKTAPTPAEVASKLTREAKELSNWFGCDCYVIEDKGEMHVNYIFPNPAFPDAVLVYHADPCA